MSFLSCPKPVKLVFQFWKPIFVILMPMVSLPLALKGGTDANGEDLTKVGTLGSHQPGPFALIDNACDVMRP